MLDNLSRLYGLQSLSTIFMSLSAITLAVGLMLLISPPAFQRLAARLNRFYSARQTLKGWETPRGTERFFYRHHRVFGLLIVIGVVVYFASFAGHSQHSLVAGLAAYLPEGTADWIVPGLLEFFNIANVLILLVGVIVFFRPSLLKAFEQRANRWISTRRMVRHMVVPNEAAEALLARAPRRVGAAIVVGSLYVLINFAILRLG